MKAAFAVAILSPVILVLNFSPSFQQTPKTEPSLDWSYLGSTGPDFWGPELNPRYSLCSSTNTRQSPINIKTERATFVGNDTMGNILKITRGGFEVHHEENNFHFECKRPGTCGTLQMGQNFYHLIQFHFHAHSEHQINGDSKAFEIHLVHQTSHGLRAAVGILVDTGADSTIDLREPLAAITSGREFEFDLNSVIESSSGFFRYSGGLTTPPCSNDLQWVVQIDIGRMAADEVQEFLQVVGPSERGNWRPVQSLGKREVRRFGGQ